MTINITVNGRAEAVQAEADTPLLWIIRDELGLTGTKFGCGIAQCGACTVFVNGMPRRSCVTPISTVADADIITIEGVSDKVAQAVQAAWTEIDVPQCGYCQSGQIMSAIALLSEIDKPTDKDIDLAMNGNVCRCCTYHRIRAAIHDASKRMEG